MPMRVDVAKKVIARYAVRRAHFLERELSYAPHPFAGIPEICICTL